MGEFYTLGTWCGESPQWLRAMRVQNDEWKRVIDALVPAIANNQDFERLEVLVKLQYDYSGDTAQDEFFRGFFDEVGKHPQNWKEWKGL